MLGPVLKRSASTSIEVVLPAQCYPGLRLKCAAYYLHNIITTTTTTTTNQNMDQDYINWDHIKAFELALKADEDTIPHISSHNDWAPISERVAARPDINHTPTSINGPREKTLSRKDEQKEKEQKDTRTRIRKAPESIAAAIASAFRGQSKPRYDGEEQQPLQEERKDRWTRSNQQKHSPNQKKRNHSVDSKDSYLSNSNSSRNSSTTRSRSRSRDRDWMDWIDERGLGFGYTLGRWPMLFIVGGWLVFLCILYGLIRIYVALYEWLVTWRGHKQKLRQKLRQAQTYNQWKAAAHDLDEYLDLEPWKHDAKFAYYDYRTVVQLLAKLRQLNSECEAINAKTSKKPNGKKPNGSRRRATPSHYDHDASSPEAAPATNHHQEDGDADADADVDNDDDAIHDLCMALQGCVKYNFAGTQRTQLYSQCYYGTKDVVAEFNKEIQRSLAVLAASKQVSDRAKRSLFRDFSRNYGKSALCLSGGACFSYRHFGVAKALLDAGLLPNIISGTSGGGLVAALLCTRTNEELETLLVPELADKITACWEPFPDWFYRWYRTGARFDAVDWAERCMWFTRGSLTFKEAFELTGKVLNISTVPADPHSPVILLNHVTAPNAVIWSALIASAAVPGFLNPVVLMMKVPKSDKIVPFHFGAKWKDGSLRTDIPISALNTYFNVTCTIVSQVNPHISLFFYAPRGSVGRPVSHRRGRGWRGGFLGSAVETMVRLELHKWLQVFKIMNVLPQLNGQDWSNIWLQKFNGTVTLWPKIRLVDFYYILSDPTRDQLATMIEQGQSSAFPRLLYIKHFINIERAIEKGRKACSSRKNLFLDSVVDDKYYVSSAEDEMLV